MAPDFMDFLAQLRRGDPEAARRLLVEFEPEVRRLVHLRLTDPRLRRSL